MVGCGCPPRIIIWCVIIVWHRLRSWSVLLVLGGVDSLPLSCCDASLSATNDSSTISCLGGGGRGAAVHAEARDAMSSVSSLSSCAGGVVDTLPDGLKEEGRGLVFEMILLNDGGEDDDGAGVV
jgi:hypothetical protein